MRKFTEIITIFIATAVLMLINTVCKPCHGLMAMPCEHSTKIAEIILLILIILNASALFVKKNHLHYLTAVLSTASGIFIQFIPCFGRCQVASMSCNIRTFPVLSSAGIIIFISYLIFLIISIIKAYSRRQIHADAQ